MSEFTEGDHVDGNGAEESSRRARPGRRRFLAGFGSTALAASAVVFGGASEAKALVKVQCCTLLYQPSVSYSTCMNGRHYVWSCKMTNTVGCGCCEVLNSSNQMIKSAYVSCSRV